MTDNLIRSLTIDGFRAFEHFEMRDLGRVNLLVGKNNCGKSSVLEAIQIASMSGDPFSLWSILARRGEKTIQSKGDNKFQYATVRHLFHGHGIEPGIMFRISQARIAYTETVDVSIREDVEDIITQKNLFSPGEPDDAGSEFLVMGWQHGSRSASCGMPLSRTMGLSERELRYFRNRRAHEEQDRPTILIPASSLNSLQIVSFFENIVLTSEENYVLEAMRTIEPSIERVATALSEGPSMSLDRAGFLVKLAGTNERLPIGNLGDGIWRLFGLALSLAKSANGILLIDEIDTGLHYTVMEKMWRLVYEGAKRLNVQVFATTHSRDCYESLAAIASSDEHDENGADVTIQRIEREKHTAVAFTGPEIVIAAERDIEVR